MSRQQPPYSTDGWGRPIQDPLDETKYLVKSTNNSTNELPKFNPIVKVLFEEEEREYFVNVVPGISEPSNKRGYLILNEFTELVKDRDVELLENTLFDTPIEAFWNAKRKLEFKAEEDFKEYSNKPRRRKKKPKNGS